MGIQTNQVILSMQSKESQEKIFTADVSVVNLEEHHLYRLIQTSDKKFLISGGDIATSGSVSVETEAIASGGYQVTTRFAPNNLSVIDSEWYGLQVLINPDDTAVVTQREYSVIYQIRDFID